MLVLAGSERVVGWLVPSSFHSNEGATGVRRLYLNKSSMSFCYSFENRKALFDIHRSFKFDLVMASKTSAGTSRFRAGFYLADPEWLFAETKDPEELTFTKDMVTTTGGSHLTFVDARTQMDLGLVVTQYEARVTDWGEFSRLTAS